MRIKIIDERESTSSMLAAPRTTSRTMLAAFWVDVTLAVVSLIIAGVLFLLRKRLHLDRIPTKVSQSLGSIFPRAATPSDDPADAQEASSVLASTAKQKVDSHPTIHTIETTQQHPSLSGTKQKPNPAPPVARHDAPSRSDTFDDDVVMPAINTVHTSSRPKPEIIRPTPQPQPEQKPEVKPEPAKPPKPDHDPRVTVPTAEQLAALPDDMFEAGAQRLHLEGLDKPTSPKPSSRGSDGR